MIPVLFPNNATSFTTQGLGALSDVVACTVEEERNGIFEMALEYPIDGLHFNEITLRSIITAIPSPHRTAQPFRVYKIGKAINGICTIYAQHISYDLSGMPVKPCSGATNVLTAMNLLKDNSLVTCPFTMWTDKTVLGAYSVTKPGSVKALLGGSEGSILDVFGTGEFEWDGYTVKLHLNRGSNSGFVINYGKNLIDLTQEENIGDTVTGIYPYWYNEESSTLVQLDDPIVNCSGTYPYTKVVPVDFSGDFAEAPTQAELLSKAQNYITNNKVGSPTVSLTLSFNEIGSLEQCDLCDTVTVSFDDLGISETAEIIRIKTDVLLERYDEIEVGDPKTTLADIIIAQEESIQKKPDTSNISQAVLDATQLIAGALGGNYVLIEDDNGKPTGFAIMDTEEKETCLNVWRFTAGGLGHSSNGWAGPYSDVAITMDGRIIANELQVLSDQYLSSYFRVEMVDSKPVVSIGAEGSNITLKIENNRIAFYQGDTLLAYWTNNTFCMVEMKEFRLGNTKMVSLGNDSIGFVEAIS